MPRRPRPSMPTRNNPTSIPETVRGYYKSTWGFDPVADCRIVGGGRFRYEESFPLSQDLPLQAVGITICARVDWEGEAIHNHIVFRRTDDKGQQTETNVECTHTVVYAGPASDVLAFVDDLNTSPDTQNAVTEEMLDGPARPVALPPWEHFAALKSYVAAVVDMGVLALVRQSPLVIANNGNGFPFGFNAAMKAQVEGELYRIAPRVMLSIYRDWTSESLDTHPPDPQVGQRLRALLREDSDESILFDDNSEHKPWGDLLRQTDKSTLVYWFRHTEIADKLQDRLFINPALLAKARAIAPDLPWDTLRLEWQARQEAEDMDCVTYQNREIYRKYLDRLPLAEVWARTPFCEYSFPRDILSPDSTISSHGVLEQLFKILRLNL